MSNKEVLLFLGVGLIIFFGVVLILSLLMVYFNTAICESRWSGSGFNTQYTHYGGCRIQLEDGRWIPANNYREISEGTK